MDLYPTIPPRAADPPWPGAWTTGTHTGTTILLIHKAAYHMTHRWARCQWHRVDVVQSHKYIFALTSAYGAMTVHCRCECLTKWPEVIIWTTSASHTPLDALETSKLMSKHSCHIKPSSCSIYFSSLGILLKGRWPFACFLRHR